ncbi:WD40 repeat domain-containing protein [Catellatospora bangladeshensis]|uniref:WD40 repeat domain-containing protein n=1 Tax=Catellatospora bangladeshensis TaxID=310355 RepID=A0A8J3JA72_9ACTN|nr:hypothetical protein [Catellatospora bangladeshensis]GIF80511.1 hypothetical protein Cba03nite_18600 [Catellatospora bangladeshensis]
MPGEQVVLPHPRASELTTFRAPDGGVRLVSSGSDALYAWDPATGEQTAMFEGEWGVFATEICHPDGRGPVLALATEYGVEWFDAATGARCHGESAFCDTVWDLAVARTPDGAETLFGAGYCGPHPIYRWDAATGALLPDLGEHDNHIVAVAVVTLPGGKLMVSATGWSRTIHRWDPATGAELGPPLAGHTAIVNAMSSAALPDGRVLLVSGDSAGVVRRWDAVTGEEVGKPIKAHPASATVLTTLVAGHPQLLTSGDDQVIRRWDAVTGELLDEPAAGCSPVLLTVGGVSSIATCCPVGVTVRPFQLS